jgi:hypothetical protein
MKYCAQHDQRYMEFLRACPICVGEALAGVPGADVEVLKNFENIKPAPSPPPVKLPAQLSLFD